MHYWREGINDLVRWPVESLRAIPPNLHMTGDDDLQCQMCIVRRARITFNEEKSRAGILFRCFVTGQRKAAPAEIILNGRENQLAVNLLKREPAVETSGDYRV